jgi:ribosome-associated translation inhibitor RaiA
MTAAETAQIRVETHGEVPQWAVGLARAKVESVLRIAAEPILSARVTLAMAPDPAVARPAVAQATIDMNGRVIRAQAAEKTVRLAVEQLGTRLRVRLGRVARNWAALRGTTATDEPGEWRQQSIPVRRPPYFPRPVDQRLVIGRASYSAGPQTPDEAAAELDLLDYDFHLFTERSTGQDCVLYRVPGGFRLVRAHPEQPRPAVPLPALVTVSDLPVPTLTVASAAELLNAAGEPFVFFVDAATGRGTVLYHRYDGHYGQLVPADEEA